MRKHNNNQKGFGAIGALLILVILVVIVVVGWVVYKDHHKATVTSSTSKTQLNLYAILPPATVPSKAKECSDSTQQQVATGLTVKLTCSNGDLNIVAWNRESKAEGGKPVMLTLGYNATATQVCNAYNDNFVTGTFAEDAYELAAQYYGWHFTTNPILAAESGGPC